MFVIFFFLFIKVGFFAKFYKWFLYSTFIMRGKFGIFSIFMVFLLVAPIVCAQDVGVGLYVLNLGKFDVATGSFTVDFYIDFKCESNCSPDFEFLNGRAASVDKIIDLPNEKFYRIQANLNSPVNLMGFPFDKQKMQIIIEDKRKQVDEISFVPLEDESGMDDSIAFTGWNIDGVNIESKEHNYDIYGETYSQYVYSVNISRIGINSFFKIFLPVIFIILIVVLTFVMDPDKIITRLTMTSSGLIAAVMFHISMGNQIPPVGYLTVADKFMILTYFVILVSVILNIVLLELTELKKHDLVEKVHRATEYSMLIVVPILYILFFIFFV
jgi:hypothetical protein